MKFISETDFTEILNSVRELIEKKNFTFKLLVTKINGKLVKKENRSEVSIQDGDDVAVIHLISGG